MKKIILVVFLCIQLLGVTASAAEAVPYNLQSKILIKVLTYERTLGSEAGELIIGILGNPSSNESVAAQNAMFNAIKDIGPFTIQKRPTTVVKLSDPAEKRIHVLYITPGVEDRLSEVVLYARDHGILTVSGESSYMDKGISLGILPYMDQKKGTRIVISLKATKAEGADFASRLLRLATVLK